MSMDDSFLVQVLDTSTRGEVLLDPMFYSTEEIIKEAKIGGSLGCSGHALPSGLAWPGKNIGTLSRCAEMESGKPRHSWN